MEWQLKENSLDHRIYTLSKDFNGDLYVITVYVEKSLKSDKFWIGVSSGKKKNTEKYLKKKNRNLKEVLKPYYGLKILYQNFLIGIEMIIIRSSIFVFIGLIVGEEIFIKGLLDMVLNLFLPMVRKY